MKKRFFNMKFKDSTTGYLFLMPWLIGLFLFTLYPVAQSFIFSLSNVTISPTTGIGTELVGFKWYIEAFADDATFTVSLLDTLQFILLSTPMIVVAALLLAVLLNGKFKGRTLYRAIFFFPVIIISGPVISELINTDAAAVIDPQNYFIYDFIESLPGILSGPLIYIFDNIVLILWFSGVQVVMFLAGLQKIDKPTQEAAAIDGASKWQMFWKIYLPYLKPLVLLNTIFTIVVLSGFSSNKVNGEILNKMRLTGKIYSYSSALSWIYFVILAVMLGIAFVLLRPKKVKVKGAGL